MAAPDTVYTRQPVSLRTASTDRYHTATCYVSSGKLTFVHTWDLVLSKVNYLYISTSPGTAVM